MLNIRIDIAANITWMTQLTYGQQQFVSSAGKKVLYGMFETYKHRPACSAAQFDRVLCIEMFKP